MPSTTEWFYKICTFSTRSRAPDGSRLASGHLGHTAAHVFQQGVGGIYVVALAGAEVNGRLVIAVKIGSAGLYQLEFGRQLFVERRIFGRVFAMVDLEALQAVV